MSDFIQLAWFASSTLMQLRCNACRNRMSAKDVISHGTTRRTISGEEAYFFEVCCSKCGVEDKVVLNERKMDIHGAAKAVNDVIREGEQGAGADRGKITQTETLYVNRTLAAIESDKDLLALIGADRVDVSGEDINGGTDGSGELSGGRD